ncbi:interaptin [Solenopsis invicta]|uniref:interaptin n=1 Tax=Solenopsis invicta TaxID=13686 RepID=UPI00193D713F|nr:interaptin [Solenopsis invicta]
MELWEKVILEWINCLKVQEETVKSITELQDGAFYINFLKLIKWKKLENFDHEDITRFIEEEYPTFKINKEDNAEHIYIASLLLLHMCRMLFKIHDSMQYNMCDKLKNETQIRVKAFLESILPIGNEITKETMREVIMEVEDTSTVADNFKTPPSENFFNSPVTRSARSQRIMTERIRELRDLRSNLAIERFTNTDLRDDITRQHNKIKKLEKKLEEKSAKIKELREERLKPITPKPSHTKEENSREDYYKRYINDLENQLTKQQDENNKLETEKDDISKELCCVRRTANHYKENFANCERSLESLSNTIELKDRELIELRMHNEELRAHIKELNGAANPEQSFEIEELSFSVAKSLNTSEPLSSVIDIQLQEAKEESAILHAQVDSLKGRFDLLTKDHRSLLESNRNLQEKVKMLNQVQAELNHVQKELDESNTIVASLQIEKNSLITQTEDMKSSLLFKEKKLSETEQSNIKLNTELDGLKLDIKNLNEILENERINSLNLNAILEQTKLQMTEYLASIHKLTDERDSYNFSIENCCKNLRNILHCDNQFIQVKIDDLNNATLNDLTDYIDTMLHNCNAMHVSYKNDIGKLNTMIDETNTNLHKQQLTITSLEEQNKQNLVQLANIEEEKKRKDLLLNEQKEIIHTYSQEIEVLEKIRDEKFILEQNICELRNNLTNRDLLLKHVMTQLEDLRDIDKNFKLIKEEIQRNIDEYKKNIELTFKTLQQGYHTLHHNYYKVQQEKKELEYNFNCNKEELSKIQAINTTLQQNLFENKEKIDALEDLLHRERSDTITQMELKEAQINDLFFNISVLKTEKDDLIRSHKETLEAKEKELVMKEEALSTLQVKIEKLVNEANAMEKNTELKEAQINDLVSNVSALKTEKDDLMRSHKETLEAKNKELVMKEEALLTLQVKIEKLVNEANAMEKNMELKVAQINDLVSNVSALKTEKDDLMRSHKETLEAKNKELVMKEEALLTLQVKIEKLLNEANAMEKNMELKVAQINDLVSSVSVLKTEKDDLMRSHKETLEAKNKELVMKEEALLTLQVKIEKLVNEANAMEKNTELKVAQINDLVSSISALKTEKDDLIRSHKETLEAKEKELVMKEGALSTLQVKIEKLVNEANVMEKNTELKEARINDLVSNVSALKTEKDELMRSHKETLEAKEKELVMKEEALSTLQVKIEILTNEANVMEKNTELKVAQINDLVSNVSALKTEKDDLMRSHKETLEAKEKELVMKEEALSTLQVKIEKLLNEANAMEKNTELKVAQINDLVSSVSALKTEKDDLMRSHKETLEAKDKELIMKEEALSTLQVKIEKLINEANAMEKNTELKVAQINDLVSSVSALKTEKDDLMRSHKETLEAKDKELVMKEEAFSTLQVKIEKLTNEANVMEKNMELKVAQINDLVSSVSALKTEKDDLMRSHKETLEAKDKELVMKEETLSTLQVKIEKLMNEANAMEKNTELKVAQINDLVSSVSALKTEKDDLMRSHKETLEAKDKELIMKEEALSTLQVKIEKLTTEANVMEKNMELKVTQINDLVFNVSALKTEKDDLMRSHKETLEAKEKELVMKEEALSTLQVKMEKLANEANVMEKKMKEVIINLQEVRSSQDAVLSTQEAALKEKCLYIEELQEQFDNSKKILNKELEAAKSSLRENQVKFFDLENQFNNQSRTIGELQDMLKTVKAELEASKEYCKQMDISQAEIVKLCQELEHPARNLNSTITDTCSDFDINDISQYECINIENKYKRINTDNNANILNIIKMTLDELYKSQKIISHLSCVNAELNKTLEKQEALIENGVKDKEEICGLKNKVRELEIIAQKRNNYLKSLIKNKESLKDSLQKVIATRNDLGTILISYKQKWNEILTKFQDIFHTDSSVCDEFKQLQIKKTDLENMLLKCQIDYSENIKSISDILWEKFLWTEQKLHDTYLCSIHEKECLDILTNVEDIFCNENVIIDNELEKFKALQTDLMKSDEEIESFTALATFYKNSLKSGQIKSQVEVEKNLQNQINQLTKERKDLKTKMDTMRLRNVKLEKNIDDLRTEIKKLKSITPVEANLVSEGAEVQSLKEELERLKEQNQQLHKEKDESSKMEKQKLENQLKEIHVTYEQKLEDMKQQMKAAYNEQIMKLNKDQEKILQDKLQNQMEMMCQRQREELDRYKTHISGLSAQLWSVGEKLLSEQQQKQDALQCLKELQNRFKEFQADQPIATISRKTCRMEKQEMLPENAQQAHKVTTLITEETLERRQSIRSMQTIGNVFRTEDEEEIFDNVYLADMKKGNFKTITDVNRLSVLQMRNSLCKPHLKSSYPAEMQFLPPTLTEEEIKSGSPEDNFNDSLSQSLLPEQKAKKKDRSQISYKKPGPPTPSKNGGRLSLQGNELKSPNSRVLRERNVDRRTTTTPHSLKNIFSLKRQDENATSTPKRRLSSLFRKSRLQSDR